MNGAGIIIYLLLLAVVVLLGCRIWEAWPRHRQHGTCIGKCMTIGDREIQEDDTGAVQKKNGTLLVLADGMGRAFGGRISSRLAVSAFLELFQEQSAFERPQYYFRRAFAAANQRILEELDDQRGGASVAAALITENRLFYALAGNVKVAVFRDGDLISVSEGHTIGVLAQQQFRAGRITREEALQILEKKRLYNYVGQDGFHDIEYFSEPITLQTGDLVVLLSDGVYECLKWRDIEDILRVEAEAQDMALNIIEKVNDSPKEHKDNASVVLLRIS